MKEITELGRRVGVSFFDYQLKALANALAQPAPRRRCLYYKTGAGKTITALGQMSGWGERSVLVVCPPSTYDSWGTWGTRFGMDVETMSHAKFRMKDTKLSRTVPIVVDEFHLLGGHGGKGWKKMDTLARHLQAPLVICSATPNYNDADRVYCIQHVLDPQSCKGGFLEFLYRHCETEQNPFSTTPDVTGFKNYPDAAAYLADLSNVDYLADDLVYQIEDVGVPYDVPVEVYTYGLNKRRRRIIASIIEERHALIDLSLIGDNGKIVPTVIDEVYKILDQATSPVLVFSNHATVADALDRTLAFGSGLKTATVTGSTPAKKKQARIDAFRDGVLDVLVGTATLATGTDGLDKVCDTLIILDDTDDASLRRQLVGRIMPRGADADATKKQVYRLVLQ